MESAITEVPALKRPLQYLHGVGPRRAARFEANLYPVTDAGTKVLNSISTHAARLRRQATSAVRTSSGKALPLAPKPPPSHSGPVAAFPGFVPVRWG